MPSARAWLVFTMATETGWAEDFILWHLPLVRFNQYWHARCYNEGMTCIWETGSQQALEQESLENAALEDARRNIKPVDELELIEDG